MKVSTFTPEIGTKICLLMATGLSIRKIIQRKDIPISSRNTIHEWMLENEAFAAQYELARKLRADELFDECLEIADDDSRDFVTKTKPDGTIYEAVDTEHINRSRLRVDTRKWVCARMDPKYSDKVVNEMVGKDGGPIQVTWKDPE